MTGNGIFGGSNSFLSILGGIVTLWGDSDFGYEYG